MPGHRGEGTTRAFVQRSYARPELRTDQGTEAEPTSFWVTYTKPYLRVDRGGKEERPKAY